MLSRKRGFMRILLLGAAGFIGRHILTDLVANGHDVTAVVRSKAGLETAFPKVRFVATDLSAATREADWAAHLHGIALIVNAAGILRGKSMDAVHVHMPRALYAAAVNAGVRRTILISAISARPDVETDYAQSKLEGEAALRASRLDWTILRPSLVYGDGSYGGTSLIRGLAALPLFTPIPGNGDFLFTPIEVRDLARAVRIACEDERFAGQCLEPGGRDTFNVRELLTRYRAWLGFGKARFLHIPMPIMRLLGRIGDIAGDGPVSTNSLMQMIAGNAGDSAAFVQAIGFSPQSLDDALNAQPAQVQDRWHARLFFLAPFVKAALFFLWIASALLGLFTGAARTMEMLQALALPAYLADPLRIGSSILDLVVAGAVLFDRRVQWSTMLQLVVVFGYTAVLGLALPSLWLDPLGSLLKNLPIIALILVHGAIGNKR